MLSMTTVAAELQSCPKPTAFTYCHFWHFVQTENETDRKARLFWDGRARPISRICRYLIIAAVGRACAI